MRFVVGFENPQPGARDFSLHCPRDGFRFFQCEANDARARTAQETAKCSGRFARAHDGSQLWNERCAIRLVKAIIKEPAQSGIIFLREGGGDERGPIQGMRGVSSREGVWKEASRFLG